MPGLSSAAAVLAIGAPMLLAFNLPPSSTFLNQAASFAGWGCWLTVLANHSVSSGRRPESALIALWSALGVLTLAMLASDLQVDLPASLCLSSIAFTLTAALVAYCGASVSRTELGRLSYRAFCVGMAVAGFLSCIVGLLQVFAPGIPDGNWIARTYIDGRAVGNMRQPNHLSSLLLWSTIAAIWLGEARILKRWSTLALALLFVFVDVLTASRTGAVSMLIVMIWGIADRRLSRSTRIFLILAPLIYGAFWYGTGIWADYSHHVFGGETRFMTKGDISSSRWGIWSNTLTLIRMHPWLGVGFGEFNFAWTLTPFPNRPVAFFDHTHNIVLQFLVELGIPLGLLVTGLLCYALLQAFRAARQPVAPDAPPGDALLKPAAFMMVLLIMVHSLLEYPLWYAYFLLPTAFCFGLCLGEPGKVTVADQPKRKIRPLVVASIVLMLGGAASLLDYSRVVVIFAPSSNDTRTLAERIAEGRKSIFFSHHANYAAATSSSHPADVMSAFKSAPYYLLDARLMQDWAIALAEAGDTDRARYVAQRLREFHNEQSAAFFAPCDIQPTIDNPPPFQCTPPLHQYKYEDFR